MEGYATRISNVLARQTYTVSEYIGEFNELFRYRVISIEGEIQELRSSKNVWLFFQLKDEHDESVLRCFAVKSRIGSVSITEGMAVTVRGYAKLHEKYGFSIVAESIVPRGEGALKKAYEERKRTLEHEGLFAPERKRPLKSQPSTIALITSRESAAYHDFLKVLAARRGGLTIHLLHTGVQGKEAIPEIVQAIEYVNVHAEEYDTAVLTRGGGSLEDLQSFNAEEVVRAVFRCRIPLVCGVGHERDETLAELAADVRASTPSNAAEIVSIDRTTIMYMAKRELQRQRQGIDHVLHREQTRLVNATTHLESFMASERTRYEHVERSLTSALQAMGEKIASQKEKTDVHIAHLKNVLQYTLKRHKEKIVHAERLLRQVDPALPLKRGFGIVRLARTNAIITSTKSVNERDLLETQLRDGTVISTVSTINTHP